MSVKYVLDAHPLIWLVEGNARLSVKAMQVLSDLDSELLIPAIALAEACWVIQKGRTSVPAVSSLLNAIDSDARVKIIPIDNAIVRRSFEFSPELEMHDRLIVATALALSDGGAQVPLITRDEAITNSGLVTVIW